MSIASGDLSLSKRGQARSSIGWQVPVALVLSVVWLYGLGSLAAIILAATTLRRGVRSTAERVILYVALSLGVIGVALTAAFFALLSSAAPS